MVQEAPEAAALLLLAGGRSRRMGQPKALLRVGEVSLVEWLAARLAPGFDQLLVSVAEAVQLPSALRPHGVLDLHAGAGPLAGIEAGLAASRQPVLVAVACDMPYVSPELLLRLRQAALGHDAAVPLAAGRPEPVCAAYRLSAAGAVAASLGAGERRAAAPLGDLDVAWLQDVDAGQLRSLNTPADYSAFLDALRYWG